MKLGKDDIRMCVWVCFKHCKLILDDNKVEFDTEFDNGNKQSDSIRIITRIKANAYDSAAFDDKNYAMYTWGSFGSMQM